MRNNKRNYVSVKGVIVHRKNNGLGLGQIFGNDESTSRYFGDSLQMTNWILDSGEMFHMTPQIYYFVPDSLEDTDKYIEFTDGHHITAKQKTLVPKKMCDNNGDTFIEKLHNVMLAPDL